MRRDHVRSRSEEGNYSQLGILADNCADSFTPSASRAQLAVLRAHAICRMADPRPTHVAGYRQWQSLGEQVQKRQPRLQILTHTGRFATVFHSSSLAMPPGAT